MSITHFNGQSATAEDLAPLAFAGFAHFTAMQVRDGAVRGLDLHLQRLRLASEEMFGRHLSEPAMRTYLRNAVEAGGPHASLTCFTTCRPGEFMTAGPELQLDVLIKVTDPASPPPGPVALDVVRHERHLPRVKHVGEVAKTLYLRQARTRGFDDAAFEDDAGRLSEATIWNLSFWDGESVIWPKADVLSGVTMQILSRQLAAHGIPQHTREVRRADLDETMAAVVMNSWTPAIPVSRIGGQQLSKDKAFTRLLHDVYRAEEPTRP